MRRYFALIVATTLTILSGARAQGPDELYIHVYNLIQEADGLTASAATGQALAKYTEAQRTLSQFQRGYPDWNPKVVAFRLNYLADRIATLSPKVESPKPKVQSLPSPALVKTPESQAPKPEIRIPKSEIPAPDDAQLNALKEQARQLQAEKQLLEAKLKEALAAQPPAADPRELVRAEEKIKSLLKETDLLKVSLAEEKSKAAATPAPDPKALIEARQMLAEANLRMAEQTHKAQALAEEKKFLENKLALLTPGTNNSAALGSTKKALQDANRQLAQQKAASAKLAADKDALQSQLAKVTAEHNQAATVRTENAAALESTRKALDQANRQLTEQTQKAEVLARQLLQNKLTASDETLAALEAVKKALQEANERLAQQTDRTGKLTTEKEALQSRVKTLESEQETAAALRAENAILKKQVADLKAAPPIVAASDSGPELAKAQAQIAALQSDKEVLRLERVAVENHVQRLYATIEANAQHPATMKPGPSSDRIRELERQRDELDTKLTAALKELNNRKSDVAVMRVAELEDELATLRARIEVFDARKIPFTEQELELLSKPAPKPAERDFKTASQSARQLSAAAATLTAEGQRCFASGQLERAEEKYVQALTDDPTNVFTLGNLAAVQLQRNRLAEAESNIGQAVTLAPTDAYSLTLLGYLKYRQQKYDDALDALSRAARFDRQNPQIQNYLGLILSEKGLRSAAETAFRKALQLDGRNSDAHLNLAVLYVSQQPPSLDVARWHYQRALAGGHPRDQRLEDMLPMKQ